MTIEYPKKASRKDKLRLAGGSLAERLPWIGAAIAAIGPFLPNHLDVDRERWEKEVTDRLNLLARLQQRPTVSRDSLAWLMALLAGKLDEDGVGDRFVSHEEWESRFAEATRIELEDALSELVDAGWIQTQSDANSPSGIGGFCATSLLFAHTHPWIHGLYPSEDAKALAAFALENAAPDADAISAMQIAEHFHWERRQLYPALSFLADEIVPDALMERYYHPDYPFIWLYLNGATRRTLRRFAADDQ